MVFAYPYISTSDPTPCKSNTDAIDVDEGSKCRKAKNISTITIEDTNERFLLLVYLKNTLIKNIKGMNFNSSSPIIEKKSETRLIIFRFKGVSSTGNKLNISKAEAIAIEYTIYMTNINTARIISFFVGL